MALVSRTSLKPSAKSLGVVGRWIIQWVVGGFIREICGDSLFSIPPWWDPHSHTTPILLQVIETPIVREDYGNECSIIGGPYKFHGFNPWALSSAAQSILVDFAKPMGLSSRGWHWSLGTILANEIGILETEWKRQPGVIPTLRKLWHVVKGTGSAVDQVIQFLG
jgi:hypothetical protein